MVRSTNCCCSNHHLPKLVFFLESTWPTTAKPQVLEYQSDLMRLILFLEGLLNGNSHQFNNCISPISSDRYFKRIGQRRSNKILMCWRRSGIPKMVRCQKRIERASTYLRFMIENGPQFKPCWAIHVPKLLL